MVCWIQDVLSYEYRSFCLHEGPEVLPTPLKDAGRQPTEEDAVELMGVCRAAGSKPLHQMPDVQSNRHVWPGFELPSQPGIGIAAVSVNVEQLGRCDTRICVATDDTL